LTSSIIQCSKEHISETGFISVLRWKGGRYLLCWPC
jgi:hypothetical protein